LLLTAKSADIAGEQAIADHDSTLSQPGVDHFEGVPPLKRRFDARPKIADYGHELFWSVLAEKRERRKIASKHFMTPQ